MKFCGNCGKELSDTALFCPQCGTAVPKNPAVKPMPTANPLEPPKQKKSIWAKVLVVVAVVLVAIGILLFNSCGTSDVVEKIEVVEEVPEEKPVEQKVSAEDLVSSMVGVWDPVSNLDRSTSFVVYCVTSNGGRYGFDAGCLASEYAYQTFFDLESAILVSSTVFQIAYCTSADSIYLYEDEAYFDVSDIDKGILYFGNSLNDMEELHYVSDAFAEGALIMERTYFRW